MEAKIMITKTEVEAILKIMKAEKSNSIFLKATENKHGICLIQGMDILEQAEKLNIEVV